MFELEDEDRQILAEDIRNLSDDESFASFKNKLSVIWRNKNKEVKSEQDREIQARIDAEVEKRLSTMNKTSIATSSVEDILDKAKASSGSALPNNNHSSSKPSQSLFEKFSEAFKKENIIIS
jgi:hypothetical protein